MDLLFISFELANLFRKMFAQRTAKGEQAVVTISLDFEAIQTFLFYFKDLGFE
jgi:hypothetical protein